MKHHFGTLSEKFADDEGKIRVFLQSHELLKCALAHEWYIKFYLQM